MGGEVKSRYADDETSMELWLHFNSRDDAPKITMSDVPQLSGSQIMRDCPITGCFMGHGLRTQSAELRDDFCRSSVCHAQAGRGSNKRVDM